MADSAVISSSPSIEKIEPVFWRRGYGSTKKKKGEVTREVPQSYLYFSGSR